MCKTCPSLAPLISFPKFMSLNLFQWEFEDDEEESDGKSSDSEDDEFATGLASELISF